MGIQTIFEHTGYVFCFWMVWKTLDMGWYVFNVEAKIDKLLHRWSNTEKIVDGKLKYYDNRRVADNKRLNQEVTVLTSGVSQLMDAVVLQKTEVEGLKKGVQQLNDKLAKQQEVPCVLPWVPDTDKSKKKASVKSAKKLKGVDVSPEALRLAGLSPEQLQKKVKVTQGDGYTILDPYAEILKTENRSQPEWPDGVKVEMVKRPVKKRMFST